METGGLDNDTGEDPVSSGDSRDTGLGREDGRSRPAIEPGSLERVLGTR